MITNFINRFLNYLHAALELRLVSLLKDSDISVTAEISKAAQNCFSFMLFKNLTRRTGSYEEDLTRSQTVLGIVDPSLSRVGTNSK